MFSIKYAADNRSLLSRAEKGVLFGSAEILDGFVQILTLGNFNSNVAMTVAIRQMEIDARRWRGSDDETVTDTDTVDETTREETVREELLRQEELTIARFVNSVWYLIDNDFASRDEIRQEISVVRADFADAWNESAEEEIR